MAYANGSQRHEQYESAGALAWVYFEAKDANWRAEVERKKARHGGGPTAEQWLEARVDQMARFWSSVSNDRGALLREALAAVRRDRKKRPDNWLHENMSHRQHRAYALFAASSGKDLSAESAEINERMYQVLCRETHVRPRLDSFGFIHDRARETIQIDILPRNLDQARNAVVGGTEFSIWEGVAALRWQRSGAVQDPIA